VFQKKLVEKRAMKKGKDRRGHKIIVRKGIIGHVTKEYNRNVHDHHVVDVTRASFEKEAQSTSTIATNAADLESGSVFLSAYRNYQQGIPHTRNNWMCEADWLELDRREKDDLLKVENVTDTFPVSRSA
jgi:hypothetical protein